jgi:5-methylcytosine-specific restriction enzyme A
VKFPLNEDNGNISYWQIPFWGEDAEKKGQYYWELRPELKKAIKELSDTDKINIRKVLISKDITQVVTIPEELSEKEIIKMPEGAKKQITINAYERNPEAREMCIQNYGYRCSVCEFDFEEVYGEIGTGFIHVHHLKPLSEINEEYQVDPVNDLRPVCPNCHSMLHKANFSIAQLRDTLRKDLGIINQ